MKRYQFNHLGFTQPLLILITAVGLIMFILLTNLGDFKDRLFGSLFSKPKSQASGLNQSEDLIKQNPYATASLNHILVKFKENVDNSKKDEVFKKHNLKKGDQISSDGTTIVDIQEGKSAKQVVNELKSQSSDTIEVAKTDEIILATSLASVPTGVFNLVGTHPYASIQASANGKILSSLYPFNNKLYVGYGDYGANTGPINIAPFDPATNTFTSSMLSAQTEAIYNFRSINGNLYGAYTDPQGGLQNITYAKGEPWTQPVTNGVDGVHIYDVVTLTGTDLLAVGAAYGGSGRAAVVWRSTDNGLTWTKFLNEEPINTTGDFARFYFAGIYNNKVYVQASDYYSGIHPNSKVFDGTNWITGPNLFSTCSGPGYRANTFAGKMVYKNWENPYWSYLKYFDGNQDYCVTAFGIYEYAIDNGYLYTLDTNGVVRRTTDLSSWQTIATAPSGSRSLAILNNILYVGTGASQLYAYSEPMGTVPTPTPTPTPIPSPTPVPTPAETIPPTVSITSPANGATVSRNSNFTTSATATDNAAVAKVEFYIDNSLKCTDTASPYSCTAKVGGKPGAAHSISAKAYDSSGNTASSSITITAK